MSKRSQLRPRLAKPARRSRGALYAACLLAIALAALLVPWFAAGWADVRAQQREAANEPTRVAERKGVELAMELRGELTRLIGREVERPYYHYQNLMHDPRSGANFGVMPSPLATGTGDVMVLGYFQLDDSGKVTTPTINDEIPRMSEQRRLAENRRFRDEVLRNMSRALTPRASATRVLVAEAGQPRPNQPDAAINEPPPQPQYEYVYPPSTTNAATAAQQERPRTDTTVAAATNQESAQQEGVTLSQDFVRNVPHARSGPIASNNQLDNNQQRTQVIRIDQSSYEQNNYSNEVYWSQNSLPPQQQRQRRNNPTQRANPQAPQPQAPQPPAQQRSSSSMPQQQRVSPSSLGNGEQGRSSARPAQRLPQQASDAMQQAAPQPQAANQQPAPPPQQAVDPAGRSVTSVAAAAAARAAEQAKRTGVDTAQVPPDNTQANPPGNVGRNPTSSDNLGNAGRNPTSSDNLGNAGRNPTSSDNRGSTGRASTNPTNATTNPTSTGNADASRSGNLGNASTGNADASRSGNLGNASTGNADASRSGNLGNASTGNADASRSGNLGNASTGNADASRAPANPANASANPPATQPKPAPRPVLRVVKPPPPPPKKVEEPKPPPEPILITISPFEWRTYTYDGQPAIVAVRNVDTPDGTLAQGFVIDRTQLTSWLATHAGDAVAALRYTAPTTPAGVDGTDATSKAVTSAATEIAPGWYLDVAANPRSLMQASTDASDVARGFIFRFVAVGVIAVLAAAFVVFLVANAEKLARERSQFAAAAAHELRTPLAGLQLYGDMLADGLGDPGKLRDYARRMSEEASRLGRVVSNVLGFSQLERGNLSVEARDGDLGVALCELADRATPALDRAGAVLDLDVPPDLRGRFDRDALARIVGNLLDNAEKYGREAEDRTITLAAREVGEAVEVVVSDRGPGVTPTARAKLFRAFSRGVTSDGPAGLGLGLALSQSLARAMGGELSYRPSTEGASFVLRLEKSTT